MLKTWASTCTEVYVLVLVALYYPGVEEEGMVEVVSKRRGRGERESEGTGEAEVGVGEIMREREKYEKIMLYRDHTHL